MRTKINVIALFLLMFIGSSAFAQTYKLVLDCEYGAGTPFLNTTIVVNYKRTIHTFSTPGGPIIPPQVSNFTATEHFAPGRQYHTINQYTPSNGFVSYEITGMSISYDGIAGAGVPNTAQLDQINTCCYTIGESVFWGTHRADILNQSDAGETWINVRMVQ